MTDDECQAALAELRLEAARRCGLDAYPARAIADSQKRDRDEAELARRRWRAWAAAVREWEQAQGRPV